MTDVREMGPWDAEMIRLGAEGAVRILSDALTEAVLAAPRQPSRVAVRFGCASIEVEWPPPPASTEPATAPGTGSAPEAVDGSVDGSVEEVAGHVVRADLVGTFYRAPEPGATPFVNVGDVIEPGTQVALVEAMKLMNPVVTDVGGRVLEILVEDAAAVEYDQPLLLIDPGADE